MTSTEAELLGKLMDANHKQNRGDIEDLKKDVKSIQGDVADIKKTLNEWIGAQSLSKWLIVTSISLCGLMLTIIGVFLAYHKQILGALNN